MTFSGKKATGILFLGDIALFIFSLWLTLSVRYAAFPGAALFFDHLRAFATLFVIWTLVFYMAGLYGKRMILFKSELPRAILRTQILNIVIAALFFFFVPGFGITPKTSLAIYLCISLLLIFIWRLWLFPRITRPASREGAALIGSGPEVDELLREVNENPRYNLRFLVVVEPADVANNFEKFTTKITDTPVSTIVADVGNELLRPVLPRLYEFAFAKRRCQCLDFYTVYEEVFDRVPLSLLKYEWFLENFSHPSSVFYDALKRLIDIVGGIAMGAVTVVAAPLVYLAMRIEGSGPLFITQERLGKLGTRMRAYKFRSMRFNKKASSEWTTEEKASNPVTRVGAFLRRTSLDEFPQFLNVLRGELSLIGPRNDIEGLGMRLAEAIPYYNARYVVKPGITGWAQINQRYESGNISPQSIEENKVRLAYDFYYIKHRSFALDIVIALRTVKRMLFRVSSW